VANVKINKYTIHIGRPNINGLDCSQPQKSIDNKNKLINKKYHTKLLFFGNQKGRLFMFIPYLIYYFLALTAGSSKTMPRKLQFAK